jgi:hypothetical protein
LAFAKDVQDFKRTGSTPAALRLKFGLAEVFHARIIDAYEGAHEPSIFRDTICVRTISA